MFISILVILLRTGLFGADTCNQTAFPGASAVVAVGTSLPQCSGILIGPRHVVTSGLCIQIYKNQTKNVNVYVGGSSTNPMARKIEVKQVVVHSKFSAFPRINDVAVVELVSALTPDVHVQPMELCKKSLKEGDNIVILRKPNELFTDVNEESLGHQFLDVKAAVISHSDCVAKHKSVGANITDSMVCANEIICGNMSDIMSEGSCEMKPGRPVVYNGKLCGLTSFGVNCGTYDYPEIYSSIDTMREVIAQFNRLSDNKLILP